MARTFVKLDFKLFSLEAELFDTPVASRLAELLPISLELTEWGDELYGPIGKDLGHDRPVSEIPAGGIAYSREGNYLCIFYGQKPAWPVEHVGRIVGEEWKALESAVHTSKVTVRRMKGS